MILYPCCGHQYPEVPGIGAKNINTWCPYCNKAVTIHIEEPKNERI